MRVCEGSVEWGSEWRGGGKGKNGSSSVNGSASASARTLASSTSRSRGRSRSRSVNYDQSAWQQRAASGRNVRSSSVS